MSQSPTSYEPYSPGRPGPERAHVPTCTGGPNGLVVASVVCIVIWAMSGFGYFWPIWVLLPTLLLGGGRLWSMASRCRRQEPKMEAAASVSGHLRRQDKS